MMKANYSSTHTAQDLPLLQNDVRINNKRRFRHGESQHNETLWDPDHGGRRRQAFNSNVAAVIVYVE